MESAGNPPTKPRAALGGRFWLEEQIGSNASGELHRGIDLRSGTETAVRIVRGIGAARRDKMLRETKRAAQVKHPGLAVVLGVGQTEEGDIFVAAETIVGDRLSDRLRGGERFDDWEAAEIATQIAHAIAAAHDADVVHRELRPSLVVLTYQGDNTIVKVEGLGLPRAATEDDPELAYSAPEQRRGETAGRRADVYSIGAMLSAMLTGTAPGPGDPSIDGPLGAVVKLCLASDPRKRYADTKALSAAMNLTVQSLPPHMPSRMPMAESNPPPELMVSVLIMPKALDLTAEAAGIPELPPSPQSEDEVNESPPSPLLVASFAPPAVSSKALPAVVASAPPPTTSSTIAPAKSSVSDRTAAAPVPPAAPASPAFLAGPWPRAFGAALVMFVVARLLTNTLGAFVAALAAAAAFYIAWTRSRREPPTQI